LAWPAVAVLAVVLMVRNRGASSQESERAAQRSDSLSKQLGSFNSAATEKLTTGDSLPDVTVVDGKGHSMSARSLARGGVQYWYLYREDCAPCQMLAPTWTVEHQLRQGIMVRIAFDPARDLEPDSGAGQYAWHHSDITRTRRVIEYVPALLVTDRSGVVTAAAYGWPQVAKMGRYFGLMDPARVDSVMAGLPSGAPSR
jgi:hypothetical protein